MSSGSFWTKEPESRIMDLGQSGVLVKAIVESWNPTQFPGAGA
jgi:hypothetical protein